MSLRPDADDFVIVLPTTGDPYFADPADHDQYSGSGTKYRSCLVSYQLSDKRFVAGTLYSASDRDELLAKHDEILLPQLVSDRFGIG